MIALVTIGVLAMLTPRKAPPWLIWNASRSVPIGLYQVKTASAAKGSLAAIRLREPLKSLANTRGYLPAPALLLKPVAAATGDTVCRHGLLVTINGQAVASALTADRASRPLPRWHGCVHLTASHVFVLSTIGDSFDGRYIGPIDRRQIVGVAEPLWVTRETAPPSLP